MRNRSLHTYDHAQADRQTYMPTCMNAHMHACTHARTHAYLNTHTDTHTRTHIHTCVHTHTHTHEHLVLHASTSTFETFVLLKSFVCRHSVIFPSGFSKTHCESCAPCEVGYYGNKTGLVNCVMCWKGEKEALLSSGCSPSSKHFKCSQMSMSQHNLSFCSHFPVKFVLTDLTLAIRDCYAWYAMYPCHACSMRQTGMLILSTPM